MPVKQLQNNTQYYLSLVINNKYENSTSNHFLIMRLLRKFIIIFKTKNMRKLNGLICMALIMFTQSQFMLAQNDSTELKKIVVPIKELIDSAKQDNKTKAAEKKTEQAKTPTSETLQNPTTQTSFDKDESALIVEVYDKNTMQLVDGVEVYLFSRQDKAYIETKISQNGTVSFIIENKKLYEIRTCKNGYLKKGMSVVECDRSDKLFCLSGVFEFYVGPPQVLEGQILAKIAIDPIAVGQTIELENVYYDLGKSSLRSDSKQELNKVYNLLKQYKTLVIELSSHTDSRGGNDFNMKLSTNRAKSCFNYLVGKGISAERIKHKGYGETVLLNECADGVKCNESQHQKNRRTEISILEIEEEPCEPAL